MPQVSKRPLPPKVQQKINQLFLSTILNLKNKDQAKDLFNDLLTPTEKIMLAKRLSIAYMLKKGYNYRTISQTLKVSLTTIARVNNTLRRPNRSLDKVFTVMIRNETIYKFFQDIEQSLDKLLPPKGKNWNQWHRARHQQRRQSQPPF